MDGSPWINVVDSSEFRPGQSIVPRELLHVEKRLSKTKRNQINSF